jgi:hypothetical protein
MVHPFQGRLGDPAKDQRTQTIRIDTDPVYVHPAGSDPSSFKLELRHHHQDALRKRNLNDENVPLAIASNYEIDFPQSGQNIYAIGWVFSTLLCGVCQRLS